jgi:hypothetical protein
MLDFVSDSAPTILEPAFASSRPRDARELANPRTREPAKEGGRMHGPAGSSHGAQAHAGDDLRGERNVCGAILRLAIRHLREAHGNDFRSARDFFESSRLEFHCSVLDLDPESVRESARAIVVARGTPPRAERTA